MIPPPSIRTPYWFPGTQISGWVSPLSSLYSNDILGPAAQTTGSTKQDTTQTHLHSAPVQQKPDNPDGATDVSPPTTLLDPLFLNTTGAALSSAELIQSAIEAFHAFFPFLSTRCKQRFCDVWVRIQQCATPEDNPALPASSPSIATYDIPAPILISALWCIFTFSAESEPKDSKSQTHINKHLTSSNPNESISNAVQFVLSNLFVYRLIVFSYLSFISCCHLSRAIHAIALLNGSADVLLLTSLLSTLSPPAFFS